MRFQKQFLTVGITVAAIAGALVVGCTKEEATVLPGKSNGISIRGGGGGDSPQSAPPFNKAYVATTVGLCLGNPPNYTAIVGYFTAADGSGSAPQVSGQHCNYSGVAENPNNNTIYFTEQWNGGGATLYKVNPSTGATSVVASLWINYSLGQPFAVEEIEFDNNGNLYLLMQGSDRPLYKISATNIQSPPAYPNNQLDVTFVGNMFGIHRDQSMTSLCVNGPTMYLVSEETSTSNTKVYTVNLGTGALTLVNSYPVPGTYTNNISSYYYNGKIYVMRDNGMGTGTIYRLDSTSSVVTLANQIGLGPDHDAMYMIQFIL
jgi:hypothetical protein